MPDKNIQSKAEVNVEETIKLVLVDWLDHASFESGWHDLDEARRSLNPVIISSVGWVIKDELNYIILCANLNAQESNGIGYMCIMKDCIKSITELNYGTSKEV